MPLPISRRSALLGLTAAWSLGGTSLAFAAGGATGPDDPRFVVIILRGALDGMAAVVPYGDLGLAALRAPLIGALPGQPGGLLDLGGFYGLHPALAGLHGLYGQGELLPIHAVAGATRSRSHFEAQDSLESGAEQRMTSGWLNRAVAALPSRAAREAMAFSVDVPLLLRGPARVGSYAPDHAAQPAPELYARIAALAADDAPLGHAVAEGLGVRALAGASESNAPDPHGPAAMQTPRDRNAFALLAGTAGEMLALPNGPRIAALELGGWDTHAGQFRRLEAPLAQLDSGVTALRSALGETWRRTVVLVMTEFGRTARVNGTGGTDHGTGGVAFLAGGTVQGGRIGGTWPGLKPGQLFEGRDLAPTTDLRAVAKGLLASHLGVVSPAAQAAIFPGSDRVTALTGLIRSA